MARTSTVVGPDARKLEIHVEGPEDGRAVIFHSGTPGAGALFTPSVDAGVERGLRHVSYARPGYAGSDRHEGRTVADCAADVAEIADALSIEQFFTVGLSGGGPHALACAALMPERVLAAATMGSIAPFGAEGLDWTAGMGEENLEECAALAAGPDELLAFLERSRAEMASARGPEIHASLDGLLSDVDRRALSGAFADHFAADIHAALANGVWGWFDDDVAHASDWGFDLGAISRPVSIWQGKQDKFVPFAHGEWLLAHVGGARGELLEDEGHLSISLSGYGDVLDDLIGG